MSKHYGRRPLAPTVSPQTLWHLRRLARMSGYGDQLGRVVDKLTREKVLELKPKRGYYDECREAFFEIDPYIRDRLIRFLKEYVRWEDGQRIDVIMVSPEQVSSAEYTVSDKAKGIYIPGNVGGAAALWPAALCRSAETLCNARVFSAIISLNFQA